MKVTQGLAQEVGEMSGMGTLVSLRPGMGALYECNRIQALLATGYTDESMEKIPSVWLKGKSQPDACNPVFSAWGKAGGG